MERGSRALVLIVLAACGRIGYEGALSDGGGVDAVKDAGTLGPFSTPTLVTALASPGSDDRSPTMTADLLELYFKSDRGGGNDIYVSTRSDPSEPWGPPVRDSELSSTFEDISPSVAPDGLSMHFASNRPGSLSIDLWYSSRPSRGVVWSTPTRVAELASSVVDSGPAVDPSGLVMIFERATDLGYDDAQILRSTRSATTDGWNAPVPVAELNAIGFGQGAVWSSADRRTVYFTTTRAGTGGWDLWTATRSSASDPFDPPTEIVELNSAEWDATQALSPDQRYIIFASTRGGSYQLYEASR